VVDNGTMRPLDGVDSVYALCREALDGGKRLTACAEARISSHTLPYDEIYGGRSDWRILPPVDHPDEPARCIISGTGLTHVKSAKIDRPCTRAAMRPRTACGCINGESKAATLLPEKSAFRPSGFTKDAARRCAHTANRSSCRPMRKMAARNRKSWPFT